MNQVLSGGVVRGPVYIRYVLGDEASDKRRPPKHGNPAAQEGRDDGEVISKALE